jgi:hypothetical protein
MGKPTLFLIIILFLTTIGLLIVALNKSIYNSTKINEPTIPSTNTASPDTSLLFGNLGVATSSSYPKTYSLPILINTGTNKVTAVQLELSFNPNILTNVSIAPSTFFKNPNIVINKINNDTGRISYALTKSASESASPVHATERNKQGEGTLAFLSFESRISSVSSTITFLPRTFVTADGLEQTALISTNSAMFNILPKLGN